MKKPKTRMLVKSIKRINKQVRNLRRGVVRRRNNVEQRELMEELLSAAFRPMMLALLGKDSDIGLSSGELEAIRTDLSVGVPGSQAVEQALSRLGDPYSQLKAGQGKFDAAPCSREHQECSEEARATDSSRHYAGRGVSVPSMPS